MKISENRNGLKIVFNRFTGSNVVHIAVTINSGTRDEPDKKTGLAHFIEHTVFKGTKKFRSKKILNYLEESGGELNAFTTKEETCYYASIHKDHCKKAFELLSELVFYPVFPINEIEKEKGVVLEEIESYKDNPSELIIDEFEESLFKGHSLGNPILGTKKSVNELKRNDLQRFVEETYVPSQISLSVSGNISESFLKRMVSEYFSFSGKKRNKPNRQQPVLFEKFDETKKFETHQSHVITGSVSYSYKDKRRTALALLNNISGGQSMNSRLNMEIREKRGLAYTIESNYTPYSDSGFFFVYFGTDRKNVELCNELVRKEMNKLMKNKLTAFQIRQAKQQFKGQISLAEENRLNKVLSNGKSILVLGKIISTKEIFKRIDAVTPKQIADIANDIFAENKISTLIYKS